MSEISTENRLRLIKQIRSRYHEDRCDLSNREQILYGQSSRPPRDTYEDFPEEADGAGSVSSFGLRFLVAAALVCLVILMDIRGIDFAGVTADKIFQAISADYQEKLTEWAAASKPSV